MNLSYYILNASFKVTLDSDSFANADLQFSIAFFSNWRAGGGGGGHKDQGWCSGESACSHQCGLDLISARYHMRIEFVVGSRLVPRVFLRVLRVSSLCKNQHLQTSIQPG